MNRIRLLFLCFPFFFFLTATIFAHSGKPKYHVIIDTDGAIDDMRAVSMFLSGNEIRVLAITCSRGSLAPKSVCNKVQSLLIDLHHEGIPVGKGAEVNSKLPAWSGFAEKIRWGKASGQIEKQFDNSTKVITTTIENYPEKVTLIALGSLKTYADLFSKHPGLINKIDRIIWYGGHNIKNSFNYKVSPESYQIIKESGLQLEIIDNNTDNFKVDSNYLSFIAKTSSQYAAQISYVHSQPVAEDRIHQQHLHLWDDFVPFYLAVPLLFNYQEKENIKFVTFEKNTPNTFVYNTISKLLASANKSDNRVFQRFPVDSTLYKLAYRKIITETVKKYGEIEWKAICMTNEIHGHTGIYSIIGAKMGIRAMDYFNVGVNNLNVKSFAGNKPPLSCFNDGIQISTGATIGQGLITISDTVKTIPEAIFEFNNKKISIKVKNDIANRMKQDIKTGIEKHGLLTSTYWTYIENLAIQYWKDYNRNEIFELSSPDEKD